MRFRDAALITGDLSSYKGEIARQFSENGIPYFLDDKKSILENPMVELIRAALDTIRDFSYENVCRYLKIGLVYDREDDQEESGGFLPLLCGGDDGPAGKLPAGPWGSGA